jgi:hypothetical protein
LLRQARLYGCCAKQCIALRECFASSARRGCAHVPSRKVVHSCCLSAYTCSYHVVLHAVLLLWRVVSISLCVSGRMRCCCCSGLWLSRLSCCTCGMRLCRRTCAPSCNSSRRRAVVLWWQQVCVCLAGGGGSGVNRRGVHQCWHGQIVLASVTLGCVAGSGACMLQGLPLWRLADATKRLQGMPGGCPGPCQLHGPTRCLNLPPRLLQLPSLDTADKDAFSIAVEELTYEGPLRLQVCLFLDSLV